MSLPRNSETVKLVASIIAADEGLIDEVIVMFSDQYGATDFISERFSFKFTDYYEKEMGAFLQRRFIAMEKLVRPESLPDIKRDTNEWEKKYSIEECRCVNIDPGYISQAHLILATGKGYAHRPYLRDGIYADLTLMYKDKSFQELPWTYPDYAEEKTRNMFRRIRDRYILQLKNLNNIQ